MNAAMRTRTTSATPTPIPAFAPALRPDDGDGGGLVEFPEGGADVVASDVVLSYSNTTPAWTTVQLVLEAAGIVVALDKGGSSVQTLSDPLLMIDEMVVDVPKLDKHCPYMLVE
jgi:hypothetical protein